MAKYRRGRINDAVAKELAIALGEVREPKVVNNFVSITRAEVAPDLKYATVYFSCMGDFDEAREGLKKMRGNASPSPCRNSESQNNSRA